LSTNRSGNHSRAANGSKNDRRFAPAAREPYYKSVALLQQ
jgi:hypothetical protein